MKEIQKVVQKLSREQKFAVAPAAAYEPVQKIYPGELITVISEEWGQNKERDPFHSMW